MQVFRSEFQTHVFRADKGVERAAVSNIETHATNPVDVDFFVAQVKKRRNVQKRCFDDSSVRNSGARVNLAGRNVESHLVLVDEIGLYREFCEGDDGVAAHRAVTLVVQEEDVAVGVSRW